MNDFADSALAENANLVKPSAKDEVGALIRRKAELKIQKRTETTKELVRLTFTNLCASLFDLTAEDLKDLPDSQLLELEKEIGRRDRNSKSLILSAAGGCLIVGGLGIALAIFSIISKPSTSVAPLLFIFLFILGLLTGGVGFIFSAAFAIEAFRERYVTARRNLKKMIKNLSLAEKDAEEKFRTELLDALRPKY